MAENNLDLELEKFLKRQELIFIAKNYPRGKTVDWLAPCCENLDELIDTLRWLGFKIKNITDDQSDLYPENRFQMVETTSGVLVYVNSQHTKGLVAGRTPLLL